MRIGEVEQQTGLPRKTIRFYEQKGLLAVERSENSYREYDEGMLTRLKTIAILRRAGISVVDLQLWTDGVITTKEMLRKRLHELKDSVDTAADQVKLCQNLLAGSDFASLFDDLQEPDVDDAPDGTEQTTAENEPALLGIDIGTTTISAVVLTIPTHRLRGVYTIASGADLPETLPFAKTQDAAGIVNRIDKLIDALLHRCPTICAIGITGQMHGIVYMDENGKLLSPLYTWEDNRAGEEYDGVVPSTCVRIREKTGWLLPPGYGLATHIDLLRHGKVPPNAAKLATIMDYAVCHLTGRKTPLCHVTNAASLGFFTPSHRFDTKSMLECGVEPSILPAYTAENAIAGTIRGIPVSLAIGDNQASFMGSVQQPEETVLINFGTGSQITILHDEHTEFQPTSEIEVRPYLCGQRLISASALCGGRAYALLESFFRAYSVTCGLPDTEQYEVMNRLAAQALRENVHLSVQTTFCGIRSDHTIRGAITGIGEENLTPGALIAGTLCGMAEELYAMFQKMPTERIRKVVVSGNAVRKNPALRQVLNRVFGMEIAIPIHREEAAYGAALFAYQATEPGADIQRFYTYTIETEE